MCRPVYSVHHPKSDNSIVYHECNRKVQNRLGNNNKANNVRSYVDASYGKWKLQLHDDTGSDRLRLVHQINYHRTKSRYGSSLDTSSSDSTTRDHDKLRSPRLIRLMEDAVSAMDNHPSIPGHPHQSSVANPNHRTNGKKEKSKRY